MAAATGQAHILADGRALCYRIFTTQPLVQPEGSPLPTVFYLHGSPGSHHEATPVYNSAASQGVPLRIVAVTRPGHGGSTYHPSRTLLTLARDLVDLADALGIARFAVMGFSGGGAYALACAHLTPGHRLAGALAVSSMYPPELGTSGMLAVNRLFLGLAPWAPGLVAQAVDWHVGRLARDPDPARYGRFMLDSFDDSRPAEDRAVARGGHGAGAGAGAADAHGFMDALVQSTREGFLQGSRAFADEFALFGSPWGFELRQITAKTVIWHGAKDANVPVPIAEAAAAMIPGAKMFVAEDEAFVSLSANRMDDIIKSLLELF